MSVPLKQLEERFRRLKLEGRSVQVREWPNDGDADKLHAILEKFDPDYNKTIMNLSGLKQMPLIMELINCSKHCQFSDYDIEPRLCGDDECAETDDGLLCQRALQFHTLPINDDGHPGRFLSFEDAICRAEDGMTVEEQLKSLPLLRADSAKRDVQEAKNCDKRKKGWWKDSKVRMVAECND
eukprot:13469777-Ditylum_brightwellii.AAC.1